MAVTQAQGFHKPHMHVANILDMIPGEIYIWAPVKRIEWLGPPPGNDNGFRILGFVCEDEELSARLIEVLCYKHWFVSTSDTKLPQKLGLVHSIPFHYPTKVTLPLEFVYYETDWIWFVHELVPFQQFQKQTKFICK